MPIAIEFTRALPAAVSEEGDGDTEVDGAGRVDALGIGVFAGQIGSDGGGSDGGEAPGDTRDDGVLDPAYLEGRGFKAAPGETCVVPGPDGRVVVAVGLGPEGEATVATYRRAAAALARATERQERVATSLLDSVPETLDRPAVAQAIAEGFVLGAYRYTSLKSEPEPSRTDSFVIAGKGGKRVQAAIERGAAVAAAVCLARDLVNEPGGTLTPTAFAARAEELAAGGGFSVDVLDGAAIEREKLGGLLGVNRGSDEEARFLKLAWEPERARGTVALVGKGITFDSGGLSLKTTDSMVGMKGDMAGAAAVLATFSALDAVRPPVRVLGFLPLTDNMPGGDATRVGDVLRIRNGTTVEVLNTDAEGRLVLADGLAMASETEPDAIVDLATLTGACMVALGTKIAGLMGNHQGWVDQVEAAAEATGEPVWHLPLPDEMRKQLDSDVADVRNVGAARWGGALFAGLFLERFVADGRPWVHLDIAGPADAAEDDPETRKGGTGYGVRTLLRLLSDFRKPKTVRQ
jgi:leucyl aminopeptidase